jgi:hypothetical protein
MDELPQQDPWCYERGSGLNATGCEALQAAAAEIERLRHVLSDLVELADSMDRQIYAQCGVGESYDEDPVITAAREVLGAVDV